MSRAESHMTIDHDEIRRWAEKRKGKPSTVKRTAGKRGETGILRIDFPGYTGADSLEEITWDEFFAKFDKSKLAFLYQETTASGQKSNFNKLVKRPAKMKAGTGTAKSGVRKTSAARTRSATKSAAKPVNAPSRAKAQGQSKSKSKAGASRSKAVAKPRATSRAKTAPKPAPKAKAASRSSTRTPSRTTTKPQAKAKSLSTTRSRTRTKTAAKAKPQARSRARAR